MATTIRRGWRQFRGFSAITLKEQLAFTGWFWADLFGQVVLMIIYAYFWRAVFAHRTQVGGLNEQQAITYALMANAAGLVIDWTLIWEFGTMLRTGSIAVELTRPVDFQLRMYAWAATTLGATMLEHMLLLGCFAWAFLGLSLPADPLVWLWFCLSLAVGEGVLFCFDWIIALLAFHVTEVRGLYILRDGIAVFFSGRLVPLALLPLWLQRVAAFLPFGQVLNTPVAIFSGLIPVSEAPRALGVQLLWLAGLWAVSRPAFRAAIRSVTVQGG
jgi:ABC-2 type transport system permease protein